MATMRDLFRKSHKYPSLSPIYPYQEYHFSPRYPGEDVGIIAFTEVSSDQGERGTESLSVYMEINSDFILIGHHLDAVLVEISYDGEGFTLGIHSAYWEDGSEPESSHLVKIEMRGVSHAKEHLPKILLVAALLQGVRNFSGKDKAAHLGRLYKRVFSMEGGFLETLGLLRNLTQASDAAIEDNASYRLQTALLHMDSGTIGPVSAMIAAVKKTSDEAYRRGLEDGREAAKKEIKKALGL